MFRDRIHAGRELAAALGTEGREDAVVVGLARGGVEVAAEVARALALPLDALAVRKVGHPLQPEYGIGAVTPGRNGTYIRALDGLTTEQAAQAAARAKERADALDRRLHERRPTQPIAGRTVLLVDDGLATGATMVAAARWARTGGAARVVVAVPVASTLGIALVRREADDVVCPHERSDFHAVGLWYDDFRQVEDADVVALLDERAAAVAAG